MQDWHFKTDYKHKGDSSRHEDMSQAVVDVDFGGVGDIGLLDTVVPHDDREMDKVHAVAQTGNRDKTAP